MWPLIINVILYLVALLYFYKKAHHFSIQVAVLFLYLVFSIMGVLVVNNGVFFQQFGYYDLSRVSILPYLFNFIMILLLLRPLRVIEGNETNFVCSMAQVTNSRIKTFEQIIVVMCFAYLFVGSLWFQKYGHVEFGDIYASNREGEREYVFSSRLLNIFFFRTHQVLNWITPFWCMLEFGRIINKVKPKRALFNIILLFSCLYIGCLISSNRGGIIFTTANLCFFIVILWNHLSNKSRRLFIIIGSIVATIVIMFLMSISLSRYGDDSEVASFGVIRYLGESFPNLGIRVWDVSDEHMWGARKFPAFYQMFGGYVPEFYGDKDLMVNYFEINFRYPVNNFKTFFGDIYAEFGTPISFLIVLLYISLVNRLIKKTLKSKLSTVFVYETFTLLTWGLFNCKISQDFLIEFILYVLVVLYIRKRQSRVQLVYKKV